MSWPQRSTSVLFGVFQPSFPISMQFGIFHPPLNARKAKNLGAPGQALWPSTARVFNVAGRTKSVQTLQNRWLRAEDPLPFPDRRLPAESRDYRRAGCQLINSFQAAAKCQLHALHMLSVSMNVHALHMVIGDLIHCMYSPCESV